MDQEAVVPDHEVAAAPVAEQPVGVGAPDDVGVDRQHGLTSELTLQDQMAQQRDLVDRVVGYGREPRIIGEQRRHGGRAVGDLDPLVPPPPDEVGRDSLEPLGDQDMERLG